MSSTSSVNQEDFSVKKLISIVKQLRSPKGCPWDQAQSFSSLIPFVIEEAYEVTNSIQENDFNALKEELGDVLLHVIMLSEMANEKAYFSFEDVVQYISEKMIRRHPHVFGKEKLTNINEVLERWESIKQKENDKGLLANVPKSLPALMQSLKLQKIVSRNGFDWADTKSAIKKLEEEVDELKFAVSRSEKEEEIGDILFSIVNILRKENVDAEKVLQETNKKFRDRIGFIENKLNSENQIFSETPIKKLEEYWQESKKKF